MVNKQFKAFLISTAMAATSITVLATSATADDHGYTLSANSAIVSDYRFRGISLSDKDIAIQGGLDLASDSGFYVGTWGSSIQDYEGSEVEIDIYAGYATELNGLSFDVGVLAYTYPGSDNTHYFEAYSSVGGAVGDIGWTVGAAYAFDQSNIGDDDNIYLYLDLEKSLAETISLTGHIAYEDGAFGDDKIDWNIGLSKSFEQFSLGVMYVDTDVPDLGSGGVVLSLGASF